MIKENVVEKYIESIEDCLVEKYSYTEIQAKKRLEESGFKNSIEKCTELILEYSPHYWARKLTQRGKIQCRITRS